MYIYIYKSHIVGLHHGYHPLTNWPRASPTSPSLAPRIRSAVAGCRAFQPVARESQYAAAGGRHLQRSLQGCDVSGDGEKWWTSAFWKIWRIIGCIIIIIVITIMHLLSSLHTHVYIYISLYLLVCVFITLCVYITCIYIYYKSWGLNGILMGAYNHRYSYEWIFKGRFVPHPARPTWGWQWDCWIRSRRLGRNLDLGFGFQCSTWVTWVICVNILINNPNYKNNLDCSLW